MASDGGGWWVVAVGDGDVALVLGALSSIVAMCSWVRGLALPHRLRSRCWWL